MRTKTLLLTVALSAAGVATSMAQVYSVNAVGYINLTFKPGFNIGANQLNRVPSNNLDSLFAGVPIESLVLKFNPATGNYTSDIYDGSAWLDSVAGAPSTTVVNPGEGVFFFNPLLTDVGVTLVGEVPQGAALTVPLLPGFGMISSIVPQALPLTPANSFPQVLEMLYMNFNATTQAYDTALINDGTEWLDSVSGVPTVPTPAVGSGFFIFNPALSTINWTRSFSVN